jgi:hypothetical protein
MTLADAFANVGRDRGSLAQLLETLNDDDRNAVTQALRNPGRYSAEKISRVLRDNGHIAGTSPSAIDTWRQANLP